MKPIAVTLSRAHSIAERLQTKARELSDAAIASLSGAHVASYLAQEDTLRTTAEEAKASLALSRAIYGAVAEIRATLAAANQRVGVTDGLARQQVLNKEIAQLRALVAINTDRQVAIDDMKEVFAQRQARSATPGYGGLERTLEVGLLTRGEIKAYRAELERLQSRAHALSDSINDLNREKIKIRLVEEIAELAGL